MSLIVLFDYQIIFFLMMKISKLKNVIPNYFKYETNKLKKIPVIKILNKFVKGIKK